MAQCTQDKLDVIPFKASSASASRLTEIDRLPQDSSFVKLIEVNSKIANILYANLRKLGNDKARDKQTENVRRLLSKRDLSQGEFGILVKELGFKNEREFVMLTKEVFIRRLELNERYGSINSIDKELIKKSYDKVKKNKKDSPIYTLGEGGFCVECPFNNCDECTASSGGGSGVITDPRVNTEEGGGGIECRNACQVIKINSIAKAEYLLIGELTIACGTAAVGVAELATCFGPLGTATGGVCSLRSISLWKLP